MFLPLFGAGIVFLAVAGVAALFGFGIVSEESFLAGKVFCAFALCAAVASFGWAWLARVRPAA